MARRICFDFDGVLHSYGSGWKGATVIPDPPVPGMAQALLRLQTLGWEVVILSSRAGHAGGKEAMQGWLASNGFPRVPIFYEKPAAEIYVDDRAIRFDGSAAALLEAIDHWAGPWNKGAQLR